MKYKGCVVDVPELNGCMGRGKTIDEALENIKDAIKVWLFVEKKHSRIEKNEFETFLPGKVTV